jgi:putative ABC transport system permease protein
VLFRSPKNAIDTSAVDLESYFDVFDEWQLPPEQMQAMQRTRTGAVVGNEIAARYGWKIGDRLPLRSMSALGEDGSGDWTFDIVGIFHIRDELWPATEVFVNYDYFDAARASGRGNVNQYIVSTRSVADVDKVAQAIDDMSANSADETRTTAEKIYVGAAFRRLGNVKFMVASISAAALFALLFLTGNTMVQSVRQRIPELAVLKVYGMGDLGLMLLLITESLILCVGAALVGLLLAAAVFPSVYENFGLSRVRLPVSVVALGVGCASLLAVLSALPPALRIRGLDVAACLSRG